uniref:Uncharacterized protein n=1 Tax=Arundo donax TaxID=35708 RepID=A0A0A8YDS4_ARUDO
MGMHISTNKRMNYA